MVPKVFLAFAVGLVASLGCNRTEPKGQAAQNVRGFAFTRLKAIEEVQRAVDEAKSHSNAILLVHVDWAPMIHQRKRFAEFEREYKTRYPKNDVAFRYIDCTSITEDYEPLRSLPGWKELEKQNSGSSLVHGYGELAWVKNGRVLHVERPLNFDSVDGLVAKTVSLEVGSIDK